jgi:hypothetical protein
LRRGVTRLQFIVRNEEGIPDTEAASGLIRQATGIIMGGGSTREYQRSTPQSHSAASSASRFRAESPTPGCRPGRCWRRRHVCSVPTPRGRPNQPLCPDWAS